MNRISRRQFAKLAGSTALLVPALVTGASPPPEHVGAGGIYPDAVGSLPFAPQQPEQPEGEKKLKLTPDQEERVKQALERRQRQLAAIRSRALPYDAEPAFVFRVRSSTRKKKI
jgi:hypothetical protein